MSERQVLRQIQFVMAGDVWPGGSNPVYGIVLVSALIFDKDAIARLTVPAVIIRPGSGQNDSEAREEPGLENTEPEITLVQRVAGDALGQKATIGGNIADETASMGKGILEIQERFYLKVRELRRDGGVTIFARAKTAVTARIEKGGTLSFREYGMEIACPTSAVCPAATSFDAQVAGPNVNLSWNLPPIRYDLLRMKLRAVAGSTPPATHTDGTGVGIVGGDLGVSAVDIPGAGTRSYSLFALYDERSDVPTNEDISSVALTRTVTV